jgi:broad specificity phosphatase PhoE
MSLEKAHRLVFIRHSAPEIDENIRSTQWHLSQTGREAAKALGEKLKPKGFVFERIISSPEIKAFETAELVGSSMEVNLKVEVDSDLKEHLRNHSSFLPREEFEAGIARLFGGDPSQLQFGVETADAAVGRLISAIERQKQFLARETSDIMVVTHGLICRFI